MELCKPLQLQISKISYTEARQRIVDKKFLCFKRTCFPKERVDNNKSTLRLN
jgi:DNA-binding GntR family transcriptional regulator